MIYKLDKNELKDTMKVICDYLDKNIDDLDKNDSKGITFMTLENSLYKLEKQLDKLNSQKQ